MNIKPKPSYRDLQRTITKASMLLKMREDQVRYLIGELKKLKPDHEIFTKTIKEVRNENGNVSVQSTEASGVRPADSTK
jgi:hypothetical protein